MISNEYSLLHSEFVKNLLQIDDMELTKIEKIFVNARNKGKKIIFIGNGGSAAIASHMATDYTKNGKMRAIAFNDASLITCLANDYGFENLFEKAIEMYGEEADVLVAISSSGKSKDILNAVTRALQLGLNVVTFSGFDHDNPLRRAGERNIYINSNSYRIVEILHEYCIHTILDSIILKDY